MKRRIGTAIVFAASVLAIRVTGTVENTGCGLPCLKISGDRNLSLNAVPCVMTRGTPVRDEAAFKALGGRDDAVVVSDGSRVRVSKESARLDLFVHKLIETVRKDRRVFFVDGQAHLASINWLRDHVHEMKAYRHWESGLEDYLGFAVEHQNPKGFFYEIVKPMDDAHAAFVDPECVEWFKADHLAFIRLELEADIEYLVVEGAVRAYKATGDETWIRRILPALEKAIDYCTSDPKRWDPEHGLVKRPFTIDTWDFAYGQSSTNRRITATTPMSILHGDNSGVYQAMKQLAWLNKRFGNAEKAQTWDRRAAELKANLDKTCFNGRFFRHQVHLGHAGVPGADENEILSLSNAYDINRGATASAQTQSILDEYLKRRKTAGTFAEWFSINPPYPKFNEKRSNEYINGGIASFVAGELALAAFRNGRETYGWDILCRLQALMERDGDLYFLYQPETGKNLGGGPSGWGAASILNAFDEGLAGITDEDVCYDRLGFSPRWAVTGLQDVRYITGYECSKALVETVYHNGKDRQMYRLSAPSREIACHILLPKGRSMCKAVTLNGKAVQYSLSTVRDSVYVDFSYSRPGEPPPRTVWPKLTPDMIEIVL